MFESAVFYAFAAVLLVSATLVITSRNPVHSALFLVLAFFTAAGTWLLLRAEFLAIALVVVYVGAVIVLVAIIAAIALTLRRRKDRRYQDPSQQVRVRREERVRLVSMPAEKE